MDLFVLTEDARAALQRTLTAIAELDLREPFHLLEKVAACPYALAFIGIEHEIPAALPADQARQDELRAIYKVWQKFNSTFQPASTEILESLASIRQAGEIMPHPGDSIRYSLYRSRKDPSRRLFFYLTRSGDPEGIPAAVMRSLCVLWQVDSGFIPLHACAVVHRGGAYLFSGPSQAGKSTIASLSESLGDLVLDHDQVMIHPLPEGDYAANGWGYRLLENDAPIRAFFYLVQDSSNRLVPIGQRQMARLMWEGALEITNKLLPEQAFAALFRRIGEFSRQVPGYELHFRKSRAFWDLVDAEVRSG